MTDNKIVIKKLKFERKKSITNKAKRWLIISKLNNLLRYLISASLKGRYLNLFSWKIVIKKLKFERKKSITNKTKRWLIISNWITSWDI
jgi:hypothetical protein